MSTILTSYQSELSFYLSVTDGDNILALENNILVPVYTDGDVTGNNLYHQPPFVPTQPPLQPPLGSFIDCIYVDPKPPVGSSVPEPSYLGVFGVVVLLWGIMNGVGWWLKKYKKERGGKLIQCTMCTRRFDPNLEEHQKDPNICFGCLINTGYGKNG